ncbi:epoxide hydrolase family protein [Streptomyces sp. NPDC003328]|uniref:Epoxide hydrolase N-terminal domain-containing protein n=3 Tax=Streptomyces TaxID=1883 RepID=A0ABP7K1D0_9ACTN
MMRSSVSTGPGTGTHRPDANRSGWRANHAEPPQFTTEIDGASVHFAHIRSPERDATPLIVTHGRPGSIVEFLDIVGARHRAERTENIVRWTEFDRGGHFAALEEPDLLIDDVRAFFGELREKG